MMSLSHPLINQIYHSLNRSQTFLLIINIIINIIMIQSDLQLLVAEEKQLEEWEIGRSVLQKPKFKYLELIIAER